MTLYVVGAGGLGRETYDAVLAAGGQAAGFVDEHPAGPTCRGLPVLGIGDLPDAGDFVIGIADPRARERLAGELLSRGLTPRTVVHPRATIAPDTELGDGTVVLAHAYVSSGVRTGSHVHINYNATIGHDTALGDRVTVLPGANIAGAVRLEDEVTVGANACILQGLTVGRRTTVGAGAVVTRSCDADQVLVGVPARPS